MAEKEPKSELKESQEKLVMPAKNEVETKTVQQDTALPPKDAKPALELDDFGLPIRPKSSQRSSAVQESISGSEEEERDSQADGTFHTPKQSRSREPSLSRTTELSDKASELFSKDASEEETRGRHKSLKPETEPSRTHNRSQSLSHSNGRASSATSRRSSLGPPAKGEAAGGERAPSTTRSRAGTLGKIPEGGAATGVSEWSHQALVPREVEPEVEKEDEWQPMPALGKYDLYDDDGNLLAKGTHESDEEDVYDGLGGAGKGYTRVQIDDDAKSATSMDENTSYLFKEKGTNVVDEDDEQRDPLAQMQATKTMLTEGQRIAYVGVTRLAMVQILKKLEEMKSTKNTKKEIAAAIEHMKMWGQKMMVRLYAHMDIDSSEQVMIEQLAEHGVQPSDLTPALMKNSRVANPMAQSQLNTPNPDTKSGRSTRASSVARRDSEDAPPAYELHADEDLPEVRSPGMLPSTREIDIDLRWTVLCDLFLTLIADSVYDARSRVLLETVGEAMKIEWLDICRFEKRVTDALEMQEAAAQENWDEAEHMESRRKRALKRKYVLMGLATVGGSLVIGLSAGLLAPVIGAGLAAGFTTIGVAGTGGFLAGAGGTALITTGAVLSGGTIAVRASNRRTGAVRTFEYRPLHNNKRVNLIVTISGWMNGKVDDVRLPFSTIDPIMGDIYSVLWEPDMLQSMGDTIRILATEALTQGLQQVLASTILTALMASLTLPIVLTKLSYLIDNPWTVSLDRADAAGLILADSLVDRNLGVRPITLVGFSLGSRVIFSCLKELAKQGAFGLVQNVYLFGSPIVFREDEYLRARTVISGRFVNGYATNDWILGYLFRATSGGISRVAGLKNIDGIPGLENVDVTSYVSGHMAYRAAMPRLLREVGWEVESDEFTEIEDPDPDNHERRQRELIREIEDARKDAKEQQQQAPEKAKGKFSWFKKKPGVEKKGWETYDERSKEEPSSNTYNHDPNGNHLRGDSKTVLFDIEAIRAELASEMMEVRELPSTAPVLMLDLNSPSSTSTFTASHARGVAQTEKVQQGEFSELRPTRSAGQLHYPASLTSPPSFTPQRHDYEYDELDDAENPNLNGATGGGMTKAFDRAAPPTHSSSQRPGLRAAATLPVGTASEITPNRVEQNAWAEEEEDEFGGGEREVKMSFE